MIKTYPITVAMTPAYFDAEHMLLRTQLKCLSLQTIIDFDVLLIDPHYSKRKDIVPELASRFGLDISHVPYTPNTRIGKFIDCSIFNAAFVYSESEIVVRYSCYRFVRPNFIEKILALPKGVNCDFYMLSLGPCLLESDNKTEPLKHKQVWDFDGEDVHWEQVPKRSGCDMEGKWKGDQARSLSRWIPISDWDTEVPEVAPLNMYGNIAWNRAQWLDLNGTNEVISNFSHWEDIDFDLRANMAKQLVLRRTRLMYRLHHNYGNYSQRSNHPTDTALKQPCESCRLTYVGFGDERVGAILNRRLDEGAISLHHHDLVWVCRECLTSGPIYGSDGIDGYLNKVRTSGDFRAPIIKDLMIGRNLRILSDDMSRAPSLASKTELFDESWSSERYY